MSLWKKNKFFRWFFAFANYFIAAAFLYYEMAAQVSPSVMTDSLMRAFGISAGGLGLLSSFYFYSYALMQVPAGLIYDRVGKRIVIPIAISLCAMGIFAFGLTDTFTWACVGRFLMGIGSAFAFVGLVIVSARWFPEKIFAFLVGFGQFIAAMGALGGSLPLSYSIEKIGWRLTMNMLGWVGVALFIVAILLIRSKKLENKHKKPITVLTSLNEVIHSSQNWWVAIFTFCLWGPMAVFGALWGVPFLMCLYKIPSTEAAAMVAFVWIGLGIAAPIFGVISEWTGRRNPYLWGGALLGIIASIFALYIPVPRWLMYVSMLCLGVASASQVLAYAVSRDINKPIVRGTSVGFNNMACVIGGAILQPIVGWVLSASWSGKMDGDIPYYSLLEYQRALSLIPVIYFVGLIAALFFIRETYCINE
ncbi:MAG: MFS transporter [Simkaniaceae bacterium]|nr:MFS transporter [Simkaniaceae bacterium]